MLKKVRFMRSKVFALTALIWGLGLPQFTYAEEPDNFQLKVIERYKDKLPEEIINKYEKGAFDLSGEQSTFVSVATKSLVGTSPGIRTIATVNNDNGELRVCSTVTIHYQIIDIDGDWDAIETYDNVPDGAGGTYTHKKTSDTIEWSIKLQTNEGELIVPIIGSNLSYLVSANKLALDIPKNIVVDGKEYSTLGASLVYQLIPHTMIGSNPYFPAAYDNVVVDDLTQGKFLIPGEASGMNAKDILPSEILKDIKDTEVDTNNKLNGQHYLTFPGLPNPDLIANQSFILNNVIQPGNSDDCLDSNVEVEIYEASEPNKQNVIQPGAWSGRKPIFVKNRYQAEVFINEANGNKRRLTRREFENQSNPFTWNVYYSTDSKTCPVSEENVTNGNCLAKAAFNIGSEQYDPARFGVKFIEENGTEVVEYAWINLQDVNKNNLLNDANEEGSEQGAILSVSFGYDN